MSVSAENCESLIARSFDSSDASRWFYTPRPLSRPRLRLFCFPYAAGSPTMFRDWPALLPDTVEMQAVTLPGRGAQAEERAVSDLTALARRVADAVRAQSDARFAFFGHSMGALLAFETARELRRRGAALPVHLFLSACHAAHRFGEGRIMVENMSDGEFVQHLARLAGTPEEVLNDRALMQILLPTLKADFLALDRWRYVPDRPFSVPITAIAGREDAEVRAEKVREWEQHTSADFNFTTVAGNHFFVETAGPNVVTIIATTLRNDAWL